MKIAIATDGVQVSPHFGHCEGFMVYEVEDQKVLSKTMVKNPGHMPGFLPQFLAEKGVNTVIAGGMGSNARSLFNERNIEVIVGASGDVDQVIEEFLGGSLQAGGNACDH